MNPEGRNSIIRRFLKLKKESDDLIPKIISDIENQLASVGVKAIVSGRLIHLAENSGQATSFYKLSDIFGFRIITINENDVYTHWVRYIAVGPLCRDDLKTILVSQSLMVTGQFILPFRAEMGKELRFKLELKRCTI